LCAAHWNGSKRIETEAKLRRSADANREAQAPRDLGSLEWDAASGVYRPRK
jgi:hypothetical protein